MPSTDRRSLLKYVALTATGVVGADLLIRTAGSEDERPAWDPPIEGDGDWAIVDRDTDRFTAEDVDGALVLTVQGPNDGADRFYDGGPGLRVVSYETTVSDADRDWNYGFGQPRLSLRIRPEGDGEGVVYFSNTNAYGDTRDEGSVSGRNEIRHAFDPGSGRGAVNPLLNYSGPADSDESGVTAIMESSVTVPVWNEWMREAGGRIEVETLRCEITETVSFIE